jgi:hypothetical protein
MSSHRWARFAAAWVTGFAVLFAGISNAHAHVHLCFDGQEAPAAVHLVDDTGHLSEHVPGSQHDDVDVDLQSQAALSKSAKHDLPAIDAIVVWTLALDQCAPTFDAPASDADPRSAPLYLHPPLRGPPR